jgi:transposase
MAKKIEESFKREVAHFALTSGLPHRQVAVDFGVSLSSVNRWV